MARQVSRPIKSASVSGPMGCPIPNLRVVSMSSRVATPYKRRQVRIHPMADGVTYLFETHDSLCGFNVSRVLGIICRTLPR